MRKIIELPNDPAFLDKLHQVAIKEKRRGKRDIKNLIEDIIIRFVENYKT